MKKEIIAVDMDWVLAKLTQKWVKTYNTIFDDNLQIEDIKCWNISNYVKPEAKDYMLNILNLHKFYRDLLVTSDSQRVLEKLSEKYEIIIVTDPFTRMSFKSKYDWLGEHFSFIPAKNYVFTGNKSIIRADYLIDDGVHNLEGFQGCGLLYDAPYNREEDEFFRVKNWQDIEHIFDCKLDEVKDFYDRGNAKEKNKFVVSTNPYTTKELLEYGDVHFDARLRENQDILMTYYSIDDIRNLPFVESVIKFEDLAIVAGK